MYNCTYSVIARTQVAFLCFENTEWMVALFQTVLAQIKLLLCYFCRAEPWPLSLPLVPAMSFHLCGFCPLVCCYKIQQLRCSCWWELPAGFPYACFRHSVRSGYVSAYLFSIMAAVEKYQFWAEDMRLFLQILTCQRMTNLCLFASMGMTLEIAVS